MLLDQVEREKEKLTKEPPAGAGVGMVARIVRELGDASAWLQSCHDTLALLSFDDDKADAPVARWLTRDPQDLVEAHASPVDASAWLANVVWRKAFGAVAMSTTLRAMGDFRHFAERSGLRRIREAAYVALPSPFDLETSAVLRVPAIVSDSGSGDAYLAQVMLELLAGVDPAEATLILCASRALMDALVERAPASWKDRMKVQGRTAIAPLLEAHRADVAAGRGSILVGLATLAEGVDLPGKQCSHEVIVKLPFAPPKSRSGRRLRTSVLVVHQPHIDCRIPTRNAAP
ncbi:MAG TPA: helicase C-terminal domain-containing protein [Acidobacteriaceae bacterium]|nr:helicase C-terminal domain-containing protein [Acidobacteriaceae bacterium]